MPFDPLDATKGGFDASEYGGVGPVGVIQPKSLGHDIEAPPNVQEQAFILRFEGKRSAGVMVDLPETDEHYDAVEEMQAKRELILGEWRVEDVP